MTPVYTSAQIRLLEKLAIKAGISADTMMAQAGENAFQLLKLHWPYAQQIAFLIGSGNNGGDGLIMARLCHTHHMTSTVFLVDTPEALSPAARGAYEAAEKAGVPIVSINDFNPKNHDLIIDALLGIGFSGALRQTLQTLIEQVNAATKPVLAIDVPSGLCADRGIACPIAIKASCTVTFIGLKAGLVTGEAANYCGDIHTSQLDLPPEIFTEVTPPIHQTSLLDYKTTLAPRLPASHKGDYGHVLIVGGNQGMSGAVKLAALAALRTGAGLVSVATHPAHAAFLNLDQPEIMSHAVDHPNALKPFIQKASVIVLGPGLGQDKWSLLLWQAVLKQAKQPIILDADGLNLLAKKPRRQANWILTPHPAEAARLLNESTDSIRAQRWHSAKTLQKKYGGVCILKGKGTIIADEEHSYVCAHGNPGMASGGMGDLLSGIIAALLAQKLSAIDAANFGVCLHGQAGDTAAGLYGERGLLASDLIGLLKKLVNQ